MSDGELMDDDDGATGSDLVVIAWFDDPADANRAASLLVERGVGAVLDESAPPRVGVTVLPIDAARAREVLSLPEAETTPEDEEQDLQDLRAVGRTWLVPVLIFAVALVTIPLIAFFIAFKSSGG